MNRTKEETKEYKRQWMAKKREAYKAGGLTTRGNVPKDTLFKENTKFCSYCTCNHPYTGEFFRKKKGRVNLGECKKQARDYNEHRRKDPETADKVKKSRRDSMKKRLRERKDDVNYRLRRNLRSKISRMIQKGDKIRSAVKDLGCTIEYLKSHLEGKFQDSMTWKNYDKYGWHIDHIIPLVRFDLTDKEQFKKACHYTNLQPLWAKDNLSKGAR